MRKELSGVARHLIFGHFAARTLRKALSKSLLKPPLQLDRSERTAVMRSIAWKAGEIMVSDQMRIIDPPSRGHLEWSAWILGAYQVLRPRFKTDDEVIEFLGEASLNGFDTRLMRLGVWLVLRACKGNLARTRAVLASMIEQYGASFDWDVHEGDDELDLRVSRCFYVEFFSSHDLPLLTTVLCRLDAIWFDRIDALKHGFRFDYDRYETMSRGAPQCVFPLVAVSVGESG
ncbi:MAG: L-2-amino-thiazoline-4-carboxylic acid hydrolase [Phycisphaerales bacterium]|jgi:hypothetical protein|nr:L-2-amino-thiazoline-4-carboxylic acid hydrolase [Phycisphaerales bacterium]